MRVAVPREIVPGERRVALVPKSVATLIGAGHEVLVQASAGAEAAFPDEAYAAAGATIVPTAKELYGKAEVVLKVRRPDTDPATGGHEADLINEGAILVAFLDPVHSADAIRRLQQRRVSSFGMELMPRITRAQDMDALSAMSTVAGYHAVLMTAVRLPRFFPLLMTAAGTITPARVLILGAGVAGLQAIATAKRLGAVVEAFDIRPAVRDQVESLGATFVEVELGTTQTETAGGYATELAADQATRQREVIAEHVRNADVVITTALIPNKPAPTLVTTEMVLAMKPGSVVLDLAAEAGGNCEATVPGEEVTVGGALVAGPLNVPSNMPTHASQLYSHNVMRFILTLLKEGGLDFEDQIVSDTCVTHAGEIRNATVRDLLAATGGTA
ncbi:MAG TPA: Re/Si-specific NAD(P)(+) transhydrogenase subunit alpha [Candidatus Dormibacteraeota bacterium]|jgi:NAD(P) transhydrogenase subunit alpha|nr:Re/Si-specific NAD(P)(+) transhydrogenase subunit alpha [Candidatus Dormibacteraeota bacterium]